MKRLLILPAVCLALSGCGIYSFSGTSIQPDVNTVTLNYFEYKAPKVNPSLSNDMTEALRTQFRKMTRLEQVEMDGDLELTGEITGYDIQAAAITANEVAARNKLTVTVKLSYENRKHPEENFENKSFSAYSEYDSSNSLESVESTLCVEIIDKIIEDIFNATVAQW